MKKLTANYKKLENRVAQINNAGTRGVFRDRTNDQPQDQQYSYQQRPRTIINKYCHAHGGCSHTSSSCNNPKNGHKKNATFQNEMGGSTVFCNDAAGQVEKGVEKNVETIVLHLSTLFYCSHWSQPVMLRHYKKQYFRPSCFET